jgi:hypothetical protein
MKQKIDHAKYDVFISYAHQDRRWVQGWLLPRLEGAGVRVCIDTRDFEVGFPVVSSIESAVAQSRFTLLVLSPDYLHNDWVAGEMDLVKAFDSAERQRQVIPLLYRPCMLPTRIAMLSYVDFTRENELEFQLDRLLVALGAKSPIFTDRSTTAPPAKREPKEYNTAAIRNLLAAAMSDEELTTFCFDVFRPVYEEFSAGMSRLQKIQQLLDYCIRHDRVSELLTAVESTNPYQYDRFRQQFER